ncbi:MAG: nucleotide exchange factor GrpE [Gammaproteobacteria bacterium]|nr:nucleotide exchange factor GrpE [Gammaproteobacteria bacterium]
MEMPIDTEEDDGTEEEQKSPEELALLLEEARNQADKHKNGLLRARAELDNLRKRTARDIENAHKYGIERLVTEMLPVRDSMELGVAAASEEGADIHKVQEGIELTLKMLIASMDKLGVEEVNPQGEKFDPELHQAMNVQEVEGAEPGSVVIVYQKGYLLNQRLVRPAMVIVAK